jgi:vitamin B12 transporter
MKTAPVYGASLSVGTAFIDAEDMGTGQTIPNIPRRTYDIGLQYDDEKSFKALLKGHYVDWNSAPSFEGKFGSFIFDLHVVKNLYTYDDQMLDVFADIHNIFNGSQYPISIFANPERWIEAGIRYVF